jgi:hypothetical protein
MRPSLNIRARQDFYKKASPVSGLKTFAIAVTAFLGGFAGAAIYYAARLQSDEVDLAGLPRLDATKDE